jgi:hypothetical protein
MQFKLVLTLLACSFAITQAGPIAYGICQAGRASVVTACYAASGATWGATLGATAPAGHRGLRDSVVPGSRSSMLGAIVGLKFSLTGAMYRRDRSPDVVWHSS